MRIVRNICCCFCVLSVLLLSTSCSKGSPQKAQDWLDSSKQDFEIVAAFLRDYDYENIRIDSTDGKMNLLLQEEVLIEDQKVVKAIRRLFKSGCYVIVKSTEDNTIAFIRWSRLSDYGAGILFALSDTAKPTMSYITRLEPLSPDGWYYYEVDYNEWRVRQKEQAPETTNTEDSSDNIGDGSSR